MTIKKDVRAKGIEKWDAVLAGIDQALNAVRSECSFCERYRCSECPIAHTEDSAQVVGGECVESYRDTVNLLHDAHAAATKMRGVIVDVSKGEIQNGSTENSS